MNSVAYTEENWDTIKYLVDAGIVLIMTATNTETEHFHESLESIEGHSNILKISQGSHTYYIGKFGNYNIAHVQCNMGSVAQGASIITTMEAITLISPKFVLMLGIAFGVDETKQNIGDVLVASAVIPYEIERVGAEQTIPRGTPISASQILLDRFKNLRAWEHFLTDAKKSILRVGQLLSGEQLIDNKDRREELKKQFPMSVGGEMEGAGLASACDSKRIEWIIVKGICDFADGKKAINKDDNQRAAVKAAISACREVFSTKAAFEELGLLPSDSTQTVEHNIGTIDKEVIHSVLFDMYEHRFEHNYIKRELDNVFLRLIPLYSLWIHGPTGCGKSNLIFRSIIVSEIKFIHIGLANCVGQDMDELFKEILYELTAQTKGVTEQITPTSFSQSHRAIIDLLKGYYNDQDVVIFIEEIPIETDSEYQAFTKKILSLLAEKAYHPKLSKIKFILSSINDPSRCVPPPQFSALGWFKFFEMKYWCERDIERLISVIEENIQVSIPSDIRAELVHEAKGSPRFIKRFYRNLLAVGSIEIQSLHQALEETKREMRGMYNV